MPLNRLIPPTQSPIPVAAAHSPTAVAGPLGRGSRQPGRRSACVAAAACTVYAVHIQSAVGLAKVSVSRISRRMAASSGKRAARLVSAKAGVMGMLNDNIVI